MYKYRIDVPTINNKRLGDSHAVDVLVEVYRVLPSHHVL